MAYAKRLYKIQVTGDADENPLSLHYSSEDLMHRAAFALRRAGFRVDGLYDYPVALNQSPDDAVKTASVFLRRAA